MARTTSLHDLYIEALRDIYNAENQLIKALPRMAREASHPQLQNAFNMHLEQTRGQVARLEEIFDMNGMRPKGKKCVAMEGLIDEGKEVMSEDWDDDVMDAALIAAAQKVEHYEIATYGTLRTWAHLMGHHDQARLLDQTLEEERRTDMHLTQIAESSINLMADHGDMAEDIRRY